METRFEIFQGIKNQLTTVGELVEDPGLVLLLLTLTGGVVVLLHVVTVIVVDPGNELIALACLLTLALLPVLGSEHD